MKAILCLLLTAAAACAAPLQKDLGEGLVYFRVHRLPADLPTDAAVPAHPCVLDIRYVTGDRSAAAALAGWLKAHARVRQPVLLLANADTSPVLLSAVAKADAIPGVVVIAPAAAAFASDVAVPVSPRRERRAYDALESGTPVEKLIDDNPPKPRNDEARLAREHISDEQMMATSEDTPLTDTPAPPRPLVDAELQRAVQVHRALVALRRL